MRIALALLIAVLLSASIPAFASDVAGKWKVISGDGSIATSTCIGSYETVDCLADSIAACDAWSEYEQTDGIYRPSPICEEVPGFVDGYPLSPLAPRDTLLHLYQIDQWTLQRAEDWLLYERDHAVARAGDTVVDFRSISCSPEPKCFEKIDRTATAAQILSHCPRTHCTDTFYVFETTNSAGQIVRYDYPLVTFLVRPEGNEWRVIDFYHRGPYYGAGGPHWLPDHWKR